MPAKEQRDRGKGIRDKKTTATTDIKGQRVTATAATATAEDKVIRQQQ